MNQKIQTLLEKIRQRGIEENIPNISRDNAEFIRKLIEDNNIQSVLEIGTAHGYSTIQIAEKLSHTKGFIDTIEFSEPSYEIAHEHIALSGFQNIRQYFGDAREIMPHLDSTYDLIFIDGMKKASLEFYLLAKEKNNTAGIILIDDVIKFKHKMIHLYEYLDMNKIAYEVVHIDSDDGIMVIPSPK